VFRGNIKRRLEALQPVELIRPDISEEPAPVVGACCAQRVLIVSEPGGDLQRRVERRNATAPLAFDTHRGVRIAPIAALPKVVEEAVEV
jgi:hypothetical protein